MAILKVKLTEKACWIRVTIPFFARTTRPAGFGTFLKSFRLKVEGRRGANESGSGSSQDFTIAHSWQASPSPLRQTAVSKKISAGW